MFRSLSLLILLNISLLSSAQAPVIQWQSSFKTSIYGIADGERCPNNRDWFYNIIEISAAKGGGYLGVGFSEMTKCENNAIAKLESYAVNGVTYYKQLKVYTPTMVRMDTEGKMIWEQIFNTPYPSGKAYFSDVVEVDDGFVACGSKLQAQNNKETLSVNNTQLTLLIGKVDVNGKIVKGFPKVFGQQYTIEDTATVAITNVLPFSTGGYCSIRNVPNSEKGFIIGTADFTNKQAALIRLDDNGDLFRSAFGTGTGYKTWGTQTGNGNGWMTARYFKNQTSEGFLLAEARNNNTPDAPLYDVYAASVSINGDALNWEHSYDSNPAGNFPIGNRFVNSTTNGNCQPTFNDRATDMEILPSGNEAVINAFCQYAYGCSKINNFYGYESSPGKFTGTDALLKIDITNNGKGQLKWYKNIGQMDGIDFNPTIVLSKNKIGDLDGIVVVGCKVFANADGTTKDGISAVVYKTTATGLSEGSTTPPEIVWNQSYQGKGFINSVLGSCFCTDGGIVMGGNNERINGDYMVLKLTAEGSSIQTSSFPTYVAIVILLVVLITIVVIKYRKRIKH